MAHESSAKAPAAPAAGCPCAKPEASSSTEVKRAASSQSAETGSAQSRTVVAQNGNSITGFKARSTSGQSAGRRSSPEKMRSDELEIHPDSIRGSSSEAAARTAPAQLRTWLERAHQEASALYTSGALNGLKSPLRGQPAADEDPRVEMFSYPRSMSPAAPPTERSRAEPAPLRSPEPAPLGPARRDGPARPRRPSPGTAPRAPRAAAAEKSGAVRFAESAESAQMEVEEDATLMSPIPLEGRRMSSEQEQLDISPHEAMLQSQLRSTQQQLEDLQRQYMEVQELLRQKRSHHMAGPSARSPPRGGRSVTPRETASPVRRNPVRQPRGLRGERPSPRRTGHPRQ